MTRKSAVGYKSRPFEDAQKLAAARAAQELLLRRSSVAYKGRHARPATHRAACRGLRRVSRTAHETRAPRALSRLTGSWAACGGGRARW